MYLISTKGYQNAKVHHLRIRKTDEIWVSMKVCIMNMYKVCIWKYDELNTKSSKFVYVKNNVITNIVKHCRGEKNRNKSNRWI